MYPYSSYLEVVVAVTFVASSSTSNEYCTSRYKYCVYSIPTYGTCRARNSYERRVTTFVSNCLKSTEAHSSSSSSYSSSSPPPCGADALLLRFFFFFFVFFFLSVVFFASVEDGVTISDTSSSVHAFIFSTHR